MPSLEAVDIIRDDPVGTEDRLDGGDGSINSSTTIVSSTRSRKDRQTATVTSLEAQRRSNTITPNSPDGSSKKQQQRKVSQQTLSSFFFSSNGKQSSQASASNNSKVKTSNKSSLNAIQQSGPQGELTPNQKTGHKKDTAVKIPTNSSPSEESDESLPVENVKVNSEALSEKMAESPGVSPNKIDGLNGQDSIQGEKASDNSTSQPAEPSKQASNETSSKTILFDLSQGDEEANSESKVSEVQAIPLDDREDNTSCQARSQDDIDQQLSDLPDDRKMLLEKHRGMIETYEKRVSELVKSASGGLICEDFELPAPKEAPVENPSDEEFPECVVANMALIIEGSPISLSKLAMKVCETLEECHSHSWEPDSVTNKIKLLAKRKSYLETPGVTVDLFEDESEDRMWRWEVISIELIPEDFTVKVKKARAERKKLLSHFTSTIKLIASLRDSEKVVVNKSLPNLDAVLAKISRNEEKVLKYEREAEKQRLSEQAKQKKISQRIEREAAAEEKRKEKERKKQEAAQKKIEIELKKQEAAQAREEAKLKKNQEREEQKRKEQEEVEDKKAKLKKQRDCMKHFFLAPPKPKRQKSECTIVREDLTENTDVKMSTAFDPLQDSDFRSIINSENSSLVDRPMFSNLSAQAINSRKRKVGRVSVSVYVTVIPKDAFDVMPFAEQRVIQVRNKYRFLSFHEDCRPPAHSTWSKTSSIVKGTNPFAKDTTYLDYDIDSEAEWEDGDDEIGEDVEDDDKNQDDDAFDEEGDLREYNYDDGFCVADENYLATNENVDEDTQLLYERKFRSCNTGDEMQQNLCIQNKVCIICPSPGGVPFTENASASTIEGFDMVEAASLVDGHDGFTLQRAVDLYLDAFPQVLVEDAGGGTPEVSSSTQKEEYSMEDLKAFATFVHLSPLNSKEKLIEELRNQHPSAFLSRAKAMRKLDSIATKRRRQNSGGVYWEVNEDVLRELGLQDLISKTLESVVDETESCSSPSSVKNSEKANKVPCSNKSGGKGQKRDEPDAPSGVSSKKKKQTESGTPVAKKKKVASPSNASANLMANFLSKGKRNDENEVKKKETRDHTSGLQPPRN